MNPINLYDNPFEALEKHMDAIRANADLEPKPVKSKKAKKIRKTSTLKKKLAKQSRAKNRK